MTDVLDQFVPCALGSRQQNSRRTQPSSPSQPQLRVDSASELCSLQCFSAVHTVRIYSTIYSKLPSNHFTFIAPRPSPSSQHINRSLFLTNLLHTHIPIPVYDLVTSLNKTQHQWIKKERVLHLSFGCIFSPV